MFSKEEFKDYFDHTLGINLLNIWVSENKIPINEKNREINIPSTLSNLFKIDLPSGKESFFSFLAERSEINWLSRIIWDRFLIDIFNKKIILVSKRIEGDKKTLCDIPTIAITIHYDLTKKVKILSKEKKINLKELYIQDGKIFIGKVLKNKIPLFFLQEKTDIYLTPAELIKYTTNADLISGNIQRTNIYNAKYIESQYGTNIPSGLSYLTKPFNFEEVAKNAKALGENVSNPEVYNEFASKEYNYGSWYENNLALNEMERKENNEKYKWW